MNLAILYWVLIGLMLVGVLGATLPGLPGTSLILMAMAVWCMVTNFAGIGWPVMILFVILVLSAAIEPLATYWGAKQVGASKWGQIGSFVGLGLGFLGFLPALLFGGPLLGILIGPVLGAFIGEFLYRSEWTLASRTNLALKASVGIIVGSQIGNLIEGLLALSTLIVFVFTTWPVVMGI